MVKINHKTHTNRVSRETQSTYQHDIPIGNHLAKITDFYEELSDFTSYEKQMVMTFRSFLPNSDGQFYVTSKVYPLIAGDYAGLRSDLDNMFDRGWSRKEDPKDLLGGALIGRNVVITVDRGAKGPLVSMVSMVFPVTGYCDDENYAENFSSAQIAEILGKI
jgi:hypothetical protein